MKMKKYLFMGMVATALVFSACNSSSNGENNGSNGNNGGTQGSTDASSMYGAPTFSVKSGYIEIKPGTDGSVVEVFTALDDATIMYTLNGDDPLNPMDSSSVITGLDEVGSAIGSYTKIKVTGIVTIKAYAFNSSYTSEVSTVSYIPCIIWDDFEASTSAEDENWGLHDSTYTQDQTVVAIDDTTAAAGTSKSLSLDNTSNIGEDWDGTIAKTFEPPIQPTYVSFYAKFQNDVMDGADDGLAVIFHDSEITSSVVDGVETYSKAAVFFEINSKCDIYAEDSVTCTAYHTNFTYLSAYDTDGGRVYGYDTLNVVKNKWYHVELVFDWTNKVYSMITSEEDGTMLSTIANIPINADYVKKLTIGTSMTGTDSQRVWIDQILVQGSVVVKE